MFLFEPGWQKIYFDIREEKNIFVSLIIGSTKTNGKQNKNAAQ